MDYPKTIFTFVIILSLQELVGFDKFLNFLFSAFLFAGVMFSIETLVIKYKKSKKSKN